MRLWLNFLVMLLITAPATAQDSDADGYTYSPDGCEFEITFPEEPYTVNRCHDKMSDKCQLMSSYTRVFDLDATVNFYLTCEPTSQSRRQEFTPDLLRTSLLARPRVSRLEVYDINLKDTDEAMMSALVGAGPSPVGNDNMIYIAQIWVGDESILSLEGELIGDNTVAADQLFADILRSLRHKDWDDSTPAITDTADDTNTTPADDSAAP